MYIAEYPDPTQHEIHCDIIPGTIKITVWDHIVHWVNPSKIHGSRKIRNRKNIKNETFVEDVRCGLKLLTESVDYKNRSLSS